MLSSFDENKMMTRLVRILLLMALAGIAIVLVLGFFGRWGQLFDSLSHFRGHLIVAGVITGLLAYWAGERKAWIACSMLVVLFAATSVFLATYSAMSAYAAAVQERCLKVVTLNVWGRNTELPKVETFLRQEDPDIVVLQEVRPHAQTLLKNLSHLYPHQIHCAEDTWCGMAMLSKLAWTEAGLEPYSDSNRSMVWARYGVGQEALFVLGLHPNIPLPGFRQSVHYKTMAEFLVRENAHTKIVGGDFNATPWSYAIQNFSRTTGLKRAKPKNPFLMTWPTFGPFPQFAIDHIFVSDGAQVPHLKRGPEVGSDHRPMVAEVCY